MNKTLSYIFLLLFPVSLWSQDGLSLDQAIDYGLSNNIDYLNTQLDAEIRKEFAFEVMTQGFPTLNLGLNYSFAFEQQVSIIPAGEFSPVELEVVFAQPHSANLSGELNQLVFDARYFYGLKARKALITSADYQVEQARISTTENITKAYYGALISQQAYELLSKNEATLQKNSE